MTDRRTYQLGSGWVVSNPIVLDADDETLSATAREHFRAQADAVFPWELALLCVDWPAADVVYRAELEERRPPWATPDDLAALAELVDDFRLPPVSPLTLQLEQRGVVGHPGYALRPRWRQDGEPLDPDAVQVEEGLLRDADGRFWRLSFGQYALLDALANVGPLGQDKHRDQEATARVLARVPRHDAGVRPDASLTTVEPRAVDALRPRLVHVGAQGYQVRPSVDGIADGDVERYTYGTPAAQLGVRNYDYRDPETGARRRAVFTEASRRSFDRVRELNVIPPEDAAKALSDPAAFFGPDLDTSQLSERVTGLGPVVRRAFPVLREIKEHEWWDWDAEVTTESLAAADTGDGSAPDERPEPPPLNLKDTATREKVAAAIQRADDDGAHQFPHPSGDGSFVQVSEPLRQAVQAAEKLAQEQAESGGKLTRPPKQVLQVMENVEALLFDRASTARPERPRALLPPPPALRPEYTLKRHQLEGYSWLVHLFGSGEHGEQWNGALLADDMGLGKTLQVLSFLSWGLDHDFPGPHLVVAPVALLENWRAEAERFFGGRFHPTTIVQGRDLPVDRHAAVRHLASQRIVLVSYETLRRHEVTFALVSWGLVVLDEAQKAKDPRTQVSRVVRALKARARLAMTGTPVENSLTELWNLVDFALPGHLGTLRQFNADTLRPLSHAIGTPDAAPIAERLQATIEPIFLRRMKRDVLDDLPARHEHALPVPLSPEQEARYAGVLGSDESALGKLTKLFGICAHPELVAAEPDLAPLDELPFPKGEALFRLLDDIRARGEKVLIFAKRRAIQHWLASEIERRHDVRVHVINGQINGSQQRLELVDDFSARPGFQAIVLAPRAAGVGLNITAANHVIHYTREWNPAVENQATDRAYRIGQTRDVHVYHLITESPRGTTVEQRLNDVLTEKRALMAQFVIPMGAMNATERDLLDDARSPATWGAAAAGGVRERAPSYAPTAADPNAARARSEPGLATPTAAPGPATPAAGAAPPRPPSHRPRPPAALPPLSDSDEAILATVRARLPDETAHRAVEILLRAGGRLRDETFAAHMGELAFRVRGLIAGLQEQLNRDAYPLLSHDPTAREVILDRERLAMAWG